MADARELISRKVAAGASEERLADVAAKISGAGAHYCAVVDATGGFAGLVRLADIARHTQAGNRILADLVSPVKPLVFGAAESAESIASLFKRYQVCEGVVLDDEKKYVGIVTAESVLEWTLNELNRKEEALRQTQTRLATASQAKDVFIRALSHELRTPLNPVLLIASEGAANAQWPRDVREQFGIIEANVLLEAHLIDGLLDLADAKRGTIRLDLQAIDTNEVLRDTIHGMRAEAERRGLHLEVTLSDQDGAEVLGDAARLGQAMAALTKNSLDSVEQGGRIQITSRPDFSAGKMIIMFHDDGRGLTNDEVAGAFDPFPRLGSPEEIHPTAERFSAGLTLARAIVVLHSGTIEVKSEGRGRGASYVVQLPFHTVA